MFCLVVIRCVLVTYSRRNTSETAAKPPQIGATSISLQVVMLHIAYYASVMLIQSGIATSSLCYFACQQRPFMLEEMLAYEVKPYPQMYDDISSTVIMLRQFDQ